MSSPVFTSEFCRVCMSRYSKAVDIYSTRLNDGLERLTGIPCAVGDGLPRSLCFLCAALLRKCVHFRDAALATDRLLRDMVTGVAQVPRDMQDVQSKEIKLVRDMCVMASEVYSCPDQNLECSPTDVVPMKQEVPVVYKFKHTRDSDDEPPGVSVMKLEVPLVFKTEVDADSNDESREGEDNNVEDNEPPGMKGVNAESLDATATESHQRNSEKKGISSIGKNSAYKSTIPIIASMASDGTPTYSCTRCEYKTKLKGNFKHHLYRHSNDKCFECQQCNKRFKTKLYLKRHIRTVHVVKPFECSKCTYVTASADKLQLHLMKHKMKPKVPRRTLAEHPSLRCRQCGLTLPTLQEFKEHSHVHTGEKLHQCSTCGFRFRQLAHLKRHNLRHTGEKPYKCTHCDYRCRVLSDLQTHIRKHTGEKPYKCTKCKYTSTTSSNLRVHLRKHTGDKPVECSQCSKKFCTNYDLKDHFLTHTGEKPYKCAECGIRFARSGSYKRHLRRNARSEPFSCSQCAYSCALKCGSTRHLADHGRN